MLTIRWDIHVDVCLNAQFNFERCRQNGVAAAEIILALTVVLVAVIVICDHDRAIGAAGLLMMSVKQNRSLQIGQ